ncbi:hypothetical protein QE438_000304 [Pseudoxanthomonas sp. SORGH_AS 997]|nr:hypothetical protein [Pseudoxanthomonas sp. SORGH_AS_0997]
MVFLEHHHVEQADAVVVAAAAAHGVLLRQAQARDRLARIQDARAGAAHGRDEGRGDRGRAAQGLQEVERGALGADQRARAPAQGGQHGAGGHALAFGHAPVDGDLRIELAMAGVEPRSPADHRLLLAQQIGDIVGVR